jgi:hypothetical protein
MESQLIKRLYLLRMHSNVVWGWRSADNVSIEIGTDRNWSCLIEQNPHLGGIFWQPIETANGKFNNGFDLFSV